MNLPPAEVWKAAEKERAQKVSDTELLRVSRPVTRVGAVLLFLFMAVWWAHSSGMVLLGWSDLSDSFNLAEAVMLCTLVALFVLNLGHGLRVHRALQAEFARIDGLEAPEGMYLMVPVEPAEVAPEERKKSKHGTVDLGHYELRPLPKKSPTGTRALQTEEAPEL